MQRVLIAAIAVVVGAVLGGTLPKAEARRLEDKMAELELRRCGPGVGSDLSTMLQGMRAPAVSRRQAPPPDPGDTDGAEPEEVEAGPRDARPAMKAAMRIRRDQARAALIEDAAPNDDQLDTIDAAVDQMNAELLELADQLATRLAQGEAPSRHDQMAFAADALDILLEADEALHAGLDPEQLDAVDDGSLDPFSYVDPAVIDKLSQIDAGRGP